MTTRICSKCGIEKDIEEFALRNQFTERRQSYCKDCRSIMGANWYERNKDYQKENARTHRSESRQTGKEYVWDYLMSHPCVNCGESDPHALEFHHVRGTKEAEVSRLIGRGASLDALKAEIEKCDVLCAHGISWISTRNPFGSLSLYTNSGINSVSFPLYSGDIDEELYQSISGKTIQWEHVE